MSVQIVQEREVDGVLGLPAGATFLGGRVAAVVETIRSPDDHGFASVTHGVRCWRGHVVAGGLDGDGLRGFPLEIHAGDLAVTALVVSQSRALCGPPDPNRVRPERPGDAGLLVVGAWLEFESIGAARRLTPAST